MSITILPPAQALTRLPTLSVIIPTYNEAENLPRLISALLALPLPGLQIAVIDDNSPDGTGQIADGLAVQYSGRVHVFHRPRKQGLGRAYLYGYQAALELGTQAIAQMDADFSHPPAKLVELLAAVERYDMALGSRYIPGGSLDDQWPFWRKQLSAFGNHYARGILGMKIQDITGGFRVFRRDTLQAMPLSRVSSDGYVFQIEMAYLAAKCGFSCVEIPIHFAERRHGVSKMSFRVQAEAALRVWQLRYTYRDVVALPKKSGAIA